MNDNDLNELGYQIIGASYEVRRHLGRFLYEGTYEKALHAELSLRGIFCERQVLMPVTYKGIVLENSYRIDLLVENTIPIELKSIKNMGASEVSQIMSYITFGGFKLGYLINFNAVDFSTEKVPSNMQLNKGIYRIINSKLLGKDNFKL